jgi:hypothetical protein
MIELKEVANLMNNHIIKESRWEKDEPVVKIEIPLCRTTPKTRTLIADSNPFGTYPIERLVIGDPFGDASTSFFFVGAILRLVPLHEEVARMSEGPSVRPKNPVFLRYQKLFGCPQ